MVETLEGQQPAMRSHVVVGQSLVLLPSANIARPNLILPEYPSNMDIAMTE